MAANVVGKKVVGVIIKANSFTLKPCKKPKTIVISIRVEVSMLLARMADSCKYQKERRSRKMH